MNPPITSDPKDDEEIRGWIAEAGDFRVETRPEHVEHVRQLLLERVVLLRPEVIPPDEVETPLGTGLIRLLALACLVAVALFGAVYLMSQPIDAWASVAQALHEKTWVHIVATGPDGLNEESWISPRFEILAKKQNHGAELGDAEFHDVASGIKDEYFAAQKTIFRDLEDDGPGNRPWNRRRMRQTQEIEVFRQLLHIEQFKVSPLPNTEIVAESRHELAGPRKPLRFYEITVRPIFGQKSDIKMIVRVDPTTRLPQTWDIDVDGGKIQMTFDYPRTGPADIHALGVPATAKRENQLPADSLDIVSGQVLSGLKAGRTRFDDYCGYVWNESVNPANLRRIWHKGHKWRVERGLPRSTTRDAIQTYDQIPIGIDLAGLLERERELIFEPLGICDGQTVWIYNYKPKALVHDQPHVSEKTSVTVQQIYGATDASNMPWPDLMPELVGHPNPEGPAQVWAHYIDPKPGDGPPGTLRFQVRDSQYQDSKEPDRFRLWIDPEKNYLALRSEIAVFEPLPHQLMRNGVTPTRLAYVETKVLSNLARSPNGFWYPRRVLRKTSNSKGEQATRFVLDFDAPIPDELFQPID